MILPYIETADYYFIWKNHNIPSSFGEEKSFLESLSDNQTQAPKIIFPNGLEFFLENNFPVTDYKAAELDQIMKNQKSEFSKTEEYGLLNRLDNETAGYLYFAKNKEIYDIYKKSQKQGIIEKHYLAQVYGNPFFKKQTNSMIIDYPIMHHKFDEKKMLVVKTDTDKDNGRGKIKYPKTGISLIGYDSKTNISSLAVIISKGVRHQIRLHLASIGCAILGDHIYGKNKNGLLCLWSLGFKKTKDGQIK